MLEDTATTEEDQSTEEICQVNGLCLMLNLDMKKK